MSKFGVRRRIANLIDPNRNLFNEAFYKQIGGAFTRYDPNSKTYLEQGYGGNPDVYAAIKQMSDKSSSIPYEIKKIEDKGSKRKLDTLLMSTKYNLTPQQSIKKNKLEEKAFKEELLDFPLDRPNETQTWTELFNLYKTFIRTTGNAYFYVMSPKEGANKGVPKYIYLLPSHQVEIILKDKYDLMGIESPIAGYMLIEGATFIEFPEEDVIHVKYSNPFYDQNGAHLYGLSPLRAALMNVQSSNEAITNNAKVMKNSGAFGFIYGKGGTLTQEQAKSIKSRLEEMDADSGRLSKLAGISTELGFLRLSLTTDELKPFDYLNFDQKAICNVLGWSTKLLNNNDDTSGLNDGAMQKEQRRVVVDNIMPDLNLLANAFNDRFLPKFKGYENTVLEFNYSELPEMQQDMEKMMNWIVKAIDIGVMCRNEGRESLKLPKSDNANMDVYTVKDDIIPLDEALDNDFTLNEQGAVSQDVA